MLLGGLAIVLWAIGTFYNCILRCSPPCCMPLTVETGRRAAIGGSRAKNRGTHFRYGGTLGVAKEMKKLTGIDCGSDRLPQRTLDKKKMLLCSANRPGRLVAILDALQVLTGKATPYKNMIRQIKTAAKIPAKSAIRPAGMAKRVFFTCTAPK